ncbi:MAG: apolipoprotein N-acyltransferase [Hyphomicrobiales bacterium]|nr:apolipoprotein N-acyltransferase [Hyphomicrobiales bacterium]
MSNLALKIGALRGWRRLLVALLAGALAAAALPPLGLWPALFVGIPVIIWLVDGTCNHIRTITDRMLPAFVSGWAFGFGYFGVSFYWIGEAFLVDADVFAWLLPFAVTAMPAGLGLFWGAATAVAAVLWSDSAGRIPVFAACFGLFEWLRGHVLTGLPWNAPGYAADAILPVAQTASLVGLYGLTFLVILWAAAPALFTGSQAIVASRTHLLVIATSVLAVLAFGIWRLAPSGMAQQTGVKVRIVQPNIAQKDKWRPENRKWIYRRYLDMTGQKTPGHKPDVVIWPESALPALLDEQEGTRRQIAQAAGSGTSVVLGSLRRSEAGAMHNSVLVLGKEGRIAGRYDKQKLVPFGEYLPLADILEPLGLRKLVAMPAGFKVGDSPQTMHVEGLPSFAPLICYEAIFPRSLIDRNDRPKWLLNVTNDAWFGFSTGPYQHLAQARMRAIEEGLPLVRAANTGISAVVDPLGRVMHSLGLGRRGTIDAILPASIPPTPYGRYGDWMFFILIVLSVFGRVRTFF